MTSTWKRTTAGLILAAGALGGAVLQASAASAAPAASATQTRAFDGWSLSPDVVGITPATARARASAIASANLAGFVTCPTERLSVQPDPAPATGFIVAVTVICVK